MLQYLDPVPFTIENESHLGLSEVQGLLCCDGRNLVIEYRIADTVIGALKTSSSSLMVPIDDLYAISYERRYFGFVNAISLRIRTPHLLDRLPEAKMGLVKMKVGRRDSGAAEAFCLGMREAIARQRSLMLEDDIARLERGERE